MTNPFFQEKSNDILDATAQAGRELVQSMKISPETMSRITQPLVEAQPFAAYDATNAGWRFQTWVSFSNAYAS